jgi:hypothetical protein
VDERGEVVSAWLFDPDGTVLEGPEGPVSHLVCGGVYDWSTGLIYKDNNYFDPLLGIWLALAPLVVVQSWRGRKRKGRGFPWYVVVLLGVCVSGLLTACGGDETSPTPCTDALPQFFSLEARFLSGPNVVPVPNRDARALGFEPPAQVLKLAQNWSLDGVQFIGIVNVPANTEGDLFMIQNVCPNDRRWRADGSEDVYGDGQTWYLDSSSPFDMDAVMRIAGPVENVVYDTNFDAPYRTVIGEPGVEDLVRVQVDTQYKMYLMWERQGWRRTLGMVKWGWRATVERQMQQDRIPGAGDQWITTAQEIYRDPGVAVSPDLRPIQAPNVTYLPWISGNP